MSENLTLSQELELLHQSKRNKGLTDTQVAYLSAWLEANQPELFGFKEINEFEEQFDEAVKVLKEQEIIWQDRIRADQTHLSFGEFLYYHLKSIESNVELKSDFWDKFEQKLEEQNGS